MSMEVTNDQVLTSTQMKQTLSGLRCAGAQLPCSELTLPEELEDHNDNLCVPRQLAALLAMDFAYGINCFENI